MAADAEVYAFITECEDRLSCLYVRPEGGNLLPESTRLTRYLFPTSLHAVGLHQPHLAVELLVVANISTDTFFSEVDEVFKDTAYKLSMSKAQTHPAHPVTRTFSKTSVLLVETSGGRIILLEYLQIRIERDMLVDVAGHISPRALAEHAPADKALIERARSMQRLATRRAEIPWADQFRQIASNCLHLARVGGFLADRLDLLPLDTFIHAFVDDEAAREETTGFTIFDRVCVYNALPTATVVPKLDAAHPGAPRLPRDGLELFNKSEPLCVLIDVTYWEPGARLLFEDSFFDVIATLQRDIQKDSKYQSRAWPYSLTDHAAAADSTFYLISVSRYGGGLVDMATKEGDELRTRCTADRIYEITQEVLGYQFHVGKNGDDQQCHIRATMIADDDEFFVKSSNYRQRLVAPVRRLSLRSLLRIEGETPAPDSDNAPAQKPTSNQATGSSASFRTGKNVLDQLRWDPKFAGSKNYEVGYEDRFADSLLWLPIEAWVQTTEEEDFIPLHRIRQFRVIATKVIVWDRATKVDRLK